MIYHFNVIIIFISASLKYPKLNHNVYVNKPNILLILKKKESSSTNDNVESKD